MLEVSWVNLGRGVWMMFAWDENCTAPVGQVTFTQSGESAQTGKDRLEILDSYVSPSHRRKGVRTFLAEKIFEHWKPSVVMSQSGTETGEPWMRAVGYKICESTGVWFLTEAMFRGKA